MYFGSGVKELGIRKNEVIKDVYDVTEVIQELYVLFKLSSSNEGGDKPK